MRRRLIVSTLLSLVFVPSVFTLLDDVGRLTWRLLGRFVGERDEPDEPAPAAAPAHIDYANREDLKIAAE